MENNMHTTGQRKMRGERAMLALPLNVVFAARIKGYVDPDALATAIGELRRRHALLAVRVSFDENKNAWYTSEDVPGCPLEIINRDSSSGWTEETSALVSRCRQEQVTVNTAVCTAFLAAQHAVQGTREPYRNKLGMAVSLRDKLNTPVGEAFGFYAASLNLKLKYNPNRPFWDQAREFHKKIQRALDRTDPFRMLVAEALPPTLIDSLYFRKYGLTDSALSMKFLRKMSWDKTSYGYSITNVGRMDIPGSYGELELDEVYGPFVYSDVNEKTVGVVTVAGKLTFTIAYDERNVSKDDIARIRDLSRQYLCKDVRNA